MNELERLVRSIRVDTAYGPPLILDNPFAPGPTNPWLARLKPMVTITPRPAWLKPVVSAPWGRPGPTQWPRVKLIATATGAVVLGLLLYGAAEALTRRRR